MYDAADIAELVRHHLVLSVEDERQAAENLARLCLFVDCLFIDCLAACPVAALDAEDLPQPVEPATLPGCLAGAIGDLPAGLA